jgi:GT2 family glycosyltransferase
MVRHLCEAVTASDEVFVVTGRILAGYDGHEGGYAPTLRPGTTPEVHQGRVGIDVLKPLNMAMRRQVLYEVGGFDERLGPGTPFPGAEDADLGFRILEAGYSIHFVPDALLYHRAWRKEEDYLPIRWSYGLAHGAFYAKHFRASPLHIVRRIIRDVVRRARRFPGRLFREGRRAWGDPLFLLGAVVGGARWTFTGRGSRAPEGSPEGPEG